MTEIDHKATVKIRFTKDAEEVFGSEDGRRRTVKIPRGTIRMVRPASARYWIRGMGVAEQINDGTPSVTGRQVRHETPASPLVSELLAIRDGLAKQDIVPVYEAFKRVNVEAFDSIDGLGGDSLMVLQAAHEEVAKTGTIDSVAVGDLTDAVNEAITALSSPAKSSVPSLPGVPAAPRGRGRPKAS